MLYSNKVAIVNLILILYHNSVIILLTYYYDSYGISKYEFEGFQGFDTPFECAAGIAAFRIWKCKCALLESALSHLLTIQIFNAHHLPGYSYYYS
jgi:hypothetical protein